VISLARFQGLLAKLKVTRTARLGKQRIRRRCGFPLQAATIAVGQVNVADRQVNVAR
jgi:hypothetical protein